MTAITIDRAVVEQALEALEWHYHQGHSNTLGGLRLKIDEKALRNLRAALAQEQAGRKPMHPELRKMWEEHFDRCFRAMPLPAQEQTGPLNLLDRAVQRRLAAQWGYVPAEQAEQAQEPVVRGAAYADALRSAIKACGAVQRDDGVWFGDDAAAKLARVLSEGIAPPRRTMVPLTDEEIDRIHLHLSSTVGSSYKTVARAIEKASWEKNHGQA